jgi:hypothetical protein
MPTSADTPGVLGKWDEDLWAAYEADAPRWRRADLPPPEALGAGALTVERLDAGYRRLPGTPGVGVDVRRGVHVAADGKVHAEFKARDAAEVAGGRLRLVLTLKLREPAPGRPPTLVLRPVERSFVDGCAAFEVGPGELFFSRSGRLPVTNAAWPPDQVHLTFVSGG